MCFAQGLTADHRPFTFSDSRYTPLKKCTKGGSEHWAGIPEPGQDPSTEHVPWAGGASSGWLGASRLFRSLCHCAPTSSPPGSGFTAPSGGQFPLLQRLPSPRALLCLTSQEVPLLFLIIHYVPADTPAVSYHGSTLSISQWYGPACIRSDRVPECVVG